MGLEVARSSRSARVIAVSLILGVGVAGASERGGGVAVPMRLESQPGWLDDGAEGGGIDAADPAGEVRTAPKADRAPLVETARRALERRGHAVVAKSTAVDTGAAAVRVHATAQGPYIAQFPRSVDGSEVCGARVNVLLDRSFVVRAITGGVAAVPVERAGAGSFRRDAASAVKSAAGAVDGSCSRRARCAK